MILIEEWQGIPIKCNTGIVETVTAFERDLQFDLKSALLLKNQLKLKQRPLLVPITCNIPKVTQQSGQGLAMLLQGFFTIG